MIRVADNQRRGASGMGGRSWETTNPRDPSQESVGQRTHESQVADIHKDFPQAPSHLSFKNKSERRKILQHVYAGSPWVDLDNIESEAVEIMEKDPGQAERFFGNRIVYGQGTWLEGHLWDACAAEDTAVEEDTEVVVGMDGSDVDDWTVIRCQTEDGFQFTPEFPGGKKMIWNPADFPNGQVPRLEVDAAIDYLFQR